MVALLLLESILCFFLALFLLFFLRFLFCLPTFRVPPLKSVYPYTQNPFQIWSKRCRSEATQHCTHTHGIREILSPQKDRYSAKLETQIVDLSQGQVRNRLQGQCPHVDSQASSLWPKQLHPLIHLHETWRGQGVFFLRESQDNPGSTLALS